MNLARYMQRVDKDGVAYYRYNPPADAVEANIVKRIKIGTNLVEAINYCNEQNELMDEWRQHHRYLKHLTDKSTVNDLTKSYINSLEHSRLGIKTRSDYAYYLKQWYQDRTAGQVLLHTRLGSLTTPMCQQIYDTHAGNSVSLANHSLAVYRLLFSYAIRNGFCIFNPFTNVKRQTDRPRRTVWTKEHIKAFMATAFSKYEWRSIGLIVYTAYCAAQRLGDMRMLTWDSYDINTGVLSLEQSKRRARVAIPLPKDLQEMLKQQHLDLSWQPFIMPASTKNTPKPYSLQQLSKVGKVVMQEAGLPDELQLMDLRRTAITEMVEVGVALTNVMALSGHATVHSLTPYVKHTLKSATVAQNMRGMV